MMAQAGAGRAEPRCNEAARRASWAQVGATSMNEVCRRHLPRRRLTSARPVGEATCASPTALMSGTPQKDICLITLSRVLLQTAARLGWYKPLAA